MICNAHLVDRHELLGCILLILPQRCKFDVLWSPRFIPEGALQGIEIVRSYRYKLSASTDILMQLVLQIDERRVGSWSKFDISQDGTGEVLANLFCLRRKMDLSDCET